MTMATCLDPKFASFYFTSSAPKLTKRKTFSPHRFAYTPATSANILAKGRIFAFRPEYNALHPGRGGVRWRNTVTTAAMAEEKEEEEVFSVWAQPPPEKSQAFREVMEALRSEFGGPAFEPHVTVVGARRLKRSEACTMLEAACKTLGPYTCRLTEVASGTFFYQCILALVDPNPQVKEANLHSSRCFGVVDNTAPYMPHMSLLYGDLTEEQKQKAKAKAEGFGHIICNVEFQVMSLCLYRTDTADKSLKSWEKVAECELKA